MPLSRRSKARVQLEAGFFTFVAADLAGVGTALPIGFYFLGDSLDVGVLAIVGASLACFALALLLLLVGALWLTKLEEE
jgi:hypothetical protein